MANTTCPACGQEVNAPLIFIGTLQMIEECPACGQGPLAVNLQRCELNTEPELETPVPLSLHHHSPERIGQALHSCHPDFMDSPEDEILRFTQHHFRNNQLIVPTPRIFVRLVILAMDNEFPDITVQSSEQIPDLNSFTDNPLYFSFEADSSLQEAALAARRNIQTFIHHLQNPAPGDAQFAVKVPVFDGFTTEELWLTEIKFSEQQFTGKVSKPPQRVKSATVGQIRTIATEELTDWRFVNGSSIYGDYSLRAMQSSLPLEKREEFAMRFR